ncbi:BglG family transcription antiterminator [Paucilactobacillus nenjiangensis]|uniref:BglG family transcription antiterminator n=1 Tax=Paucilactobacillus nenjiangensis TaxID=1296540 RepID=UPI003BB1C4A3
MINISQKKRINLLATYLVSHEYANLHDIANEFSISKRSVFYWIKDLNNQLDELEIDPVQRLTQSKYYLTPLSKEDLNQYDDLDNDNFSIEYSDKTTRRDIIIWKLIQGEHEITLSKMAEFFNVSKNTIINDFQNVKSYLGMYSLSVDNVKYGKKINGAEINKRAWVYEIITTKQNQIILNELNGADYRYLVEQLTNLQTISKVIFSDNSFEALAKFLSWNLNRIRLNTDCEVEQVPNDFHSLDSVLSDWLIKLIQQYKNTVSDNEINYFKNIIYSAQTTNIPEWQATSSLPVERLVPEIISRFSRISGTSISSEQLQIGLTAHLLSTYQRLILGIPYKSPNLEEIKNDYADLMNLTSFAIQPFEAYAHQQLPEDELALITTYFGGQTSYLKNTKSFTTNIDVILICSSGVGPSNFLKQTLKRKYTQIKFSKVLSIKEFQQLRGIVNTKLIISTVELEDEPLEKTVIVHSIPTEKDFALIDNALHQVGLTAMHDANALAVDVMDIIGNEMKIENPKTLNQKLVDYFNRQVNPGAISQSKNYHFIPSIKELLLPLNVAITNQSLNWEAAIQTAFVPLLDNHSINESYITEIISKLQTDEHVLIAKEGILLAHSEPSSKVYKLGMSLLKLSKPTDLKGHQINVIICLAPKEEKQHLRALSGLLEILQNEQKYQCLMKADSESEIASLIESLKN